MKKFILSLLCVACNTPEIDISNDKDDFSSWYGIYYSSDFQIKFPYSWENGGSSLYYIEFELTNNNAFIRYESCLWENFEYEYIVKQNNKSLSLIPKFGVYEYEPYGKIKELNVEMNDNKLILIQTSLDGNKSEFISPSLIN